MKVFKLVLLLFIISASLVFGQEKKYFFKHEFQPNSKYLVDLKTSTEVEVYTRNKDASKDLKSGRGKIGVDVRGHIFTDKKREEDVPAVIEYFNLFLEEEYDDEKSGKRKISLKEAKIEGEFLKGNELIVNNILVESTAPIRMLLLEITSKNYQSVDFPKEGIKIGDSFDLVHIYKTHIPEYGFQKVYTELEKTMKYKLTKIDSGKAYFDILISFSKKGKELEKKDLLVLGGGTGKAIFDMKNNQFIYFDTDILINYKIKIKKEELERIHKEKSIITQQKIK